jgi:aminopeptidase N
MPYSLLNAKMDQISVPAIQFDAMENQGLLTYYPGFLLCDKSTAPQWHLELISLVTIHEIAHQWFGGKMEVKEGSKAET